MTAIELAPNHKYGLVIDNPVMLAAGTIGYGETVPDGARLSMLGAVIIGPFMRNSRAGHDGPRIAETNGGTVLYTGLQNRGVKAARKKFGRLWSELGCPVIAQIADSAPNMLGRVAEMLTSAEGLSGLELLLPGHATPENVQSLVRQAIRHSDLPILAKLPLVNASALAPAAVDGGACALVVGQPPVGLGYHREETDELVPVTGSLYGPLSFAAMCATFEQVRSLDLACPLIACGGIHTATQAQQILAAGASAVQIDSAMWIEPGLPARLADALNHLG
jgi:dihydroorotate dehydrogenase (NAD+) catalytic subunit